MVDVVTVEEPTTHERTMAICPNCQQLFEQIVPLVIGETTDGEQVTLACACQTCTESTFGVDVDEWMLMDIEDWLSEDGPYTDVTIQSTDNEPGGLWTLSAGAVVYVTVSSFLLVFGAGYVATGLGWSLWWYGVCAVLFVVLSLGRLGHSEEAGKTQ